MSGARKRNKTSSFESSEKQRTKKKQATQNKSANQSSSCISKCFYGLLFVIGLVGAVAVIGYCRAPFTALPVSDYAREVKLEGKFALNQRIAKGTRNVGLIGAESIEEDEKGNLYTGLDDGRIVRIAPSSDGVVGAGKFYTITDGNLSKVTKYSGAKRGRPLGLRLIKNILYVADANFGIYSVNLSNNDVTSLVVPDAISPKIGLADDLCISKDKKFIYFTDGSSKFPLANMVSYLLEGSCDGRILQFNMESKEIRTVMSDLCLPNGIQLSSDEKLLFVSETFRNRIRIIDMMNWKTKQFVDLPTLPDNIRPTGKGTYWIAGGTSWNPASEFIQKYAFLRQIIAGLLSESTILKLLPINHNIVVEMNEDGEILQTLHDAEAKLTKGLTQASTLKDGRLVLGTFISDSLAFTEGKIDAIGNAK